MKKDIFTLLGGFLTALLLFLGTIGISFDWFTEESINAFILVLSAFTAFAINLYAIWQNTYTSKHGRAQKRALEKHGLMKKTNGGDKHAK